VCQTDPTDHTRSATGADYVPHISAHIQPTRTQTIRSAARRIDQDQDLSQVGYRQADRRFRKDVIFGCQGLYQQLCFCGLPLTYVMTTLIHRVSRHMYVTPQVLAAVGSPTPKHYRSTGQPGRSDRSGDSPEFFGDGGVCPGQRAQQHFSCTRIQVALKLTPDGFR
jgi:hypothetical protein